MADAGWLFGVLPGCTDVADVVKRFPLYACVRARLVGVYIHYVSYVSAVKKPLLDRCLAPAMAGCRAKLHYARGGRMILTSLTLLSDGLPCTPISSFHTT
jgi:hypothetical protein